MGNFNKLIMLGRLTTDPEHKTVAGGLAKFTLAVSEKYKEKEDVVFLDFTVFGQQAETFCKYTKKGSQVLIDGRLKQEKWEKDGQNFSKIVGIVNNFQLVDPAPKTATPASPLVKAGAKKPVQQSVLVEEEIPF